MHKRILCVLLLAVLLLGGLPARGSLAASGGTGTVVMAADENENLLLNSGFEEIDAETGKPTVWSTFNGWTDDTAPTATRQVHTKENPHTGDYCAKIWIDHNRNNPYVLQTVTDLVPGGTYSVGYWICSNTDGGGLFQIQLDYQKDGETVHQLTTLPSITTTSWTLYSQEFSVPEDVDSVQVLFKLCGINTVYIDDVFFRFVSEKTNYSLDTDAVFYYTDDESPAVATVYAEEAGNKTVNFVLKDGTETVAAQENVSFSEGKASFTFSVQEHLKKAKTAYTVEAAVSGEETVLSKTVYRYDRPSRLREDGTYVLNGKTIVPVIGHGVNVSEYAKVKEAGINVVTVSYWYADLGTSDGTSRIDSVLQSLHDNDLMGIIGLYRQMLPSGHSYNKSNTAKVISYLANHRYRDHIYAYSMMDEPIQNDRPAGDRLLESGYKQIRDLDGEIPVLTVDAHTAKSETKRVTDYCDIYSCDAYYAGNGALASWPGEMVTLSKEVADLGKRPVYHLTQAFDWREQFPTSGEIVHMLCQSLLAGAKGIGYYTITHATTDEDGNDVPLYNTDRWPGLVEFAVGDMPPLLEHFGEGKYQAVSNIKGEGYSGETWNKNETLHILLLNNTDDAVQAAVKLPFQDFVLSNLAGEVIETGETGEFTCSIPGRGYVLLAAEEAGKTKFFDASGTYVPNPGAGQSLSARLHLLGQPEVRGYVAAFTEAGTELLSMHVMDKTVFSEHVTLAAQVTVPAEDAEYKTFLWNTDMHPYKIKE